MTISSPSSSTSRLKKIITSISAALALTAGLVSPLTPTAAHAAPATAGWDHFHFGAAGAGFQVEGSNYDSNWLRYVNRESALDPEKVNPVKNAVDFRQRYKEDIGLAASMGLNTYRFSIEWSRIEPRKGKWNWKEIRYYDAVVKEIRSHGMVPMITTVHYVYPGWVQDQGGFMSEKTLRDYDRFTKFIANRYAANDTLWITFNEPLVFFGHEKEIGLLETTDMVPFMKNIVKAHKIAYRNIKAAAPRSKVGSNEAFLPMVTGLADQMFFVPVKDQLDFVGIDYYYGLSLDNLSSIYGASAKFSKIRPQPDAIYHSIKHFSEAFPGKPVYIVENGLPSYNGKRADGYTKGDHIYDTLFWVQRAKADGYPVVGYNYWSITDNYEWGQYNSRFGLYTVNVLKDPTLKRIPTSGVAAYRYVATHGGVPANYQLKAKRSFCSLTRGVDSCVNPPAVDGPRAPLR